MIDAEILETSRMDEPDVELLADLLRHELLDVFGYREGGPPAAAPSEGALPRTAMGWAVVTGEQTEPYHQWVVRVENAGSTTSTGVAGEHVDLAGHDSQSRVYADLPEGEASSRRRKDALAGQVADQAVSADIYITERPYLLAESTWNHLEVPVMTTVQAIGPIGLYLRAQDEFLLAHNISVDRAGFYFLATRELLPESWRWFSAAVRHSQHTNDGSFEALAGSLLDRVSRAIEARDAIHVALNQRPLSGHGADLVRSLDTFLLFLMGASDVAARVAHHVLELGGSGRSAGWQRERWLDKVAAQCPDLATVVSPDTPAWHALRILSELRNTVHGEAIRGLAIMSRTGPISTAVRIPRGQLREILPSVVELGGAHAWGLASNGPDGTLADAEIFVDGLLNHLMPVLNELMRRTPVELLPGSNMQPEDAYPPTDKPFYSERNRTRTRLQLGL